MSAKDRLIKLRDFLRDSGYTNTNLVEDWTIPQNNGQLSAVEYFDLKSTYWIKHSDVLFFVFHLNSDQSGVSSEFTELTDNNIDRVWRTVAFVEVNKIGENDPVSTRIAGRIRRHRIKRIQFPRKNDRYMFKKSLGTLPDFTSRLLKELVDRQ